MQKIFKKFIVSTVVFSTVLWSAGLPFLTFVPMAKAVTDVVIFNGAANPDMDSPIGTNTPAAVAAIEINTDQPFQFLTSVTANFSGAGFSTSTDLSMLGVGAGSGVALYDDAGGGNESAFGPGDGVLMASSTASPAWDASNNVTIVLDTPYLLSSTTANTFHLVIYTAATAFSGHKIVTTIPQNSIRVNGLQVGPAGNFTANSLVVGGGQQGQPQGGSCPTSGTISTPCQFATSTTITGDLTIASGVGAGIRNGSIVTFASSTASTTLTIQGNFFIDDYSGISKLITGASTTVSVASGGSLNIYGDMEVNGTLVNNGNLSVNGILTNNGTIDYNGSGSGMANCMSQYGGEIDPDGTGSAIGGSSAPVCSNASASNPNVVMTAPQDGMNGIPAAKPFKIFFAFDRAMSSSTIADADPTNSGSYVWLTGDGGATKASGTVYYFTDKAACDAQFGTNVCPPGIMNLGVFDVGAPYLLPNKSYELHIESGVTDTAGYSVNTNFGLPYYSLMFSTGGGMFTGDFNTLGEGGMYGAFFPPFIEGTQPTPGKFKVPTNSLIAVKFSEPMDASTLTATSGASSTIKLFEVNKDTWGDGNAASITSITMNAEGNVAKIVAALSADKKYRLKIFGNAKSEEGVKMDPSGSNNPMWISEFDTGTGADAVSPTIDYVFPANGSTNVPTIPESIDLFAKESLDYETINAQSVTLKKVSDNTPVTGSVAYDPFSNMISFVPSTALATGTEYIITASSSIKDFTTPGNALAAATSSFTTENSANTTVPEIMYAKADDYRLEVFFNIAMDATPNATSSVINKNNITIKQASATTTDFSGISAESLVNATVKYDSKMKQVAIEGLDLTIGNTFQITYDMQAKGLNGINIGAAQKRMMVGPINAPKMEGAFGPDMGAMGGGGGGMGQPMMSGGSTSFVPTGFDSANFGFVPQAEAWPFNMMAGMATNYHVNIPISKQIDASGKIILTFPTGFDISGAKQDAYSPMNSDLNGPGTGEIKFKCNTSTANVKTCSGDATISGDGGGDTNTKGGSADDGIVVDTTARTVTVTLSGATNPGGNDFISLDVAGIINTSIPKDWNTDGYKIGVKTKNAAGTVLEDVSTNPFFIQPGGSDSLTLTFDLGASDGGADTMKVYIGSPMTGPIEKITNAFNAADGTADNTDTKVVFSNLPAGEYFVFTDPLLSINGNDYAGINPPLNIKVSGNTSKTINLASDSGGTNIPVTVNLTGPANEPLDVFAGSPTGFKVKQVTLNGNGTSTVTLYLDNGDWYLGVGPQMPKGMTMGQVPQPSYVMPQPKNVKVASPSCSIDGASTTVASFTLQTANKTLKGSVQDQTGKTIANADIWAYDPLGGFGTFANADTNGQFSLKLIEGKFKIGAAIQGMPPTKEVTVEISGNVVKVDGTVLVNDISAMNNSDFIIKYAKPDYKISGTITDGSGNVVKDASVWSYRTDGPGFANANTGSDGKYTLYVSPGTWNVGVYLPGYGPMPEQSVTITDSNQTSVNFSAQNASGVSFITITGKICQGSSETPVNNNCSNGGGTILSNAFIHAEAQVGTAFKFADAVSNDLGEYSLALSVLDNATNANYTIRAWHPDYGEFKPINITINSNSANPFTTGTDLEKGGVNTISMVVKNSGGATTTVSEMYVDMFDPSNNFGNHARIANNSLGEMKLPNGSYDIHVHVPGMMFENLTVSGAAGSSITTSATGTVIAVDGNETVYITLPSLSTLSGAVTSGGQGVKDAWVEIMATSTGLHFGALTTNTNGDYSLEIPDGVYTITAMKPGYTGTKDSVTVSGATSKALTLSSASITIQGAVTTVGSTTASSSYAFVRAEKISTSTSGNNIITEITSQSGTQADANGNFTLSVSSGSWKIYAVADGYKERAYNNGTAVSVTGNMTGVNIALNESVSMAKPSSQPITPSQGGTVSAPDMGVKLTIPANALKNDNNAGNIKVKETTNVIRTTTAMPLGGKARDISATDANGQAINNLNDSVTIEMSYTKAELDVMMPEIFNASSSSPWTGLTDAQKLAKIKELKLSYWDETTGSWIERPSVMAITPASAAVYSEVQSIKVKGDTTHFTVFAVIMPFIATPVSAAQEQQQQQQQQSPGGGATQPQVSYCTTVTYNDWGSCGSDGYQTRTVKTQSPASCTLTSAQENAKKQACAISCTSITYNEWGSCSNGYQTRTVKTQSPASCTLTSAQENAKKQACTVPAEKKETETSKTPVADALKNISETVKSYADKIEQIKNDASDIFKANLNGLLGKLGVKRDLAKESVAAKKYVKAIIKNVAGITSEKQAALTNFIAYGSDTTLKLGEGERTGVLNSYKAAFGKLPASENEWSDVIKIANGRWPSTLNKARETQAEKEFKKVYKRSSVRSNPHDDAAITVIAYGLRPSDRNTGSEKAAIKSFKAIYGHTPSSATDWDIVRAIAYSGAKR